MAWGLMNDNNVFSGAAKLVTREAMRRQTEQVTALQELAGRAITHPETMTSDEVQEIGWGVLIALKRLRRAGRAPH